MNRERTLWELTRGQRVRYAAAVAAMAVSYLFLFSVPLIIRDALDAVADGTVDARALWVAGAAIVGVTAVGCLFVYLRARWFAIASEAIARKVRDRLYNHLESLPCAYHDKAETGDLVQRCTSDVETVRVFLAMQVVDISRAVLLMAICVTVMLFLDASMTAASVALFPVIIVFAVVFFRRVKALFLQVDEAEGAMTSVLQENLTGIRVVRAFSRQEFECEKFAASNEKHRDLHYRLYRLLGNYWATSDILCMAQIGLVLFAGAFGVRDGALTVGTFYAFFHYINTLIWPVRHLGRVLTDTGKAVVAMRRLREILAEAEESHGGARPESGLAGALEFRDLTFAFDREQPALTGVSFRVEPGETLALIGKPGAGKSTIVQLLLRLYDYESGSIRLDGRELKELSREFVRSQVSVVMQEPFLYSKTIGANLQLGRTGATREEMVESATDAAIHGAIEEFEHGYDTMVGERGVTLSGGQRQRVALARAILKDAPLLVLDDALSAVDTETETEILAALRDRHGRKTTIVIAHRLSSVARADKVCVLEEGKVLELGTHRELLARDGSYRRLWQIQGAFEQEMGDDMQIAGTAGRPS